MRERFQSLRGLIEENLNDENEPKVLSNHIELSERIVQVYRDENSSSRAVGKQMIIHFAKRGKFGNAVMALVDICL